MNTKLHINLTEGVIQAEGSEEFVLRVYGDFKEGVLPRAPITVSQPLGLIPAAASNAAEPKKSAKRAPTTSKRSAAGKETFELVQELYSGSLSKKFVDAIKAFNIPTGHQKKLTLYIYLLQKLDVQGITVNHVFTCYRLLGDKTPNDIRQAITDAKNKKAYIMNHSWDDLKAHHKGDEMVEDELLIKAAA